MSKHHQHFSCVRTVGGLLPHDLLSRIQAGDPTLPGLTPESYCLDGNDSRGEAVNRAWNRLVAAWKKFRARGDGASLSAGLTRALWLSPMFEELGYGKLPGSLPVVVGGKSFRFSHFWKHSPIHLLGSDVNLDQRKAGTAGAAKASPHSLVQEFLNRSDQHLWGFLSNGLSLRILRDHHGLTRQSYVEFDLQAIMDGEYYNEFSLLWSVCHRSRIDADAPTSCWLESWYERANTEGIPALNKLRASVEAAVEVLATGFLTNTNKCNDPLREALVAKKIGEQEYYRQILRLIYRLIFLFATEDRGLLLDPEATPASVVRYQKHYSTQRLRELANRRRGGPHHDLWCALRMVMDSLDNGCPALALPALGSALWSSNRDTEMPDRGCPWIMCCQCSNEHLLEAIRLLSRTEDGNTWYSVNWRNVGAEELGSVYESLLELHLEVCGNGTCGLVARKDHERKATGSYYTPPELVECILDVALDPILDRAIANKQPDTALLSIKVCDPACGSGHFLLGAARRIAKKLAQIRHNENEPSPPQIQQALHEVVGSCIYGVDVNPMAVELCKISLWMETVEPGRPLSFLDGHIRCGNALLGATPAMMAGGIPKSAFTPASGDNKAEAKRLRAMNAAERVGWVDLLDVDELVTSDEPDAFSGATNDVERIGDDTIEMVRRKEALLRDFLDRPEYKEALFRANAWCAAFYLPKNSGTKDEVLTHRLWMAMQEDISVIPRALASKIDDAATDQRYFHWHLAFPNVFSDPNGQKHQETGWRGGFDVIIGNPPWVRQEALSDMKRFLSATSPIAATADLSAFFVDLARKIVADPGTCALLSPNKWLRTQYGKSLRDLFRDRTKIKMFIDFGYSTDLFPEIHTFPCVCIFEPVTVPPSPDATFGYLYAPDGKRKERGLRTLINQDTHQIPRPQISGDRWRLEDPDVASVIEHLYRTGIPLMNHFESQIRRGISSGCNEAFVISEEQRRQIVATDERAAEIIFPWTRGADVKRWVTEKTEKHFIFARQGIDIDMYPSVKEHLEKYKDQLIPKNKAAHPGQGRSPGKYQWYELQSITAYHTLFHEPKIFVPSIMTYSQAAFVPHTTYPSNKVNIIPTNDLALLGILNSRVMWWIMSHHFVQMIVGALSVDVGALKKLPVPVPAPGIARHLRTWVQKILDRDPDSARQEELVRAELVVNNLAATAFGLDCRQMRIINQSLPPRDPIDQLATTVSRVNYSLISEEATQITESLLGSCR